MPDTEAGRRLAEYLVRSIVTTDERRAAFVTDIALDERSRAAGQTLSETIRRAIDAYLGGTRSVSTAITLTLDGWKEDLS